MKPTVSYILAFLATVLSLPSASGSPLPPWPQQTNVNQRDEFGYMTQEEPFDSARQDYNVQLPPLTTNWTVNVSTVKPWNEYPRPQMTRENWAPMNGLWTWQPDELDLITLPRRAPKWPHKHSIMVPACLESAISGVMKSGIRRSWWGRSFELPKQKKGSEWYEDYERFPWYKDIELNRRFLLHFEAIDYHAVIFINGYLAGSHAGGYSRFTVDITEFVCNHKYNGWGKISEIYCKSTRNFLQVFVFDPSDSEGFNIMLGKQTMKPSHKHYTACTGIWQSVWMETAPRLYVSSLDIKAGMDGKLAIRPFMSMADPEPTDYEVTVIDPQDKNVVANQTGVMDKNHDVFELQVPSPQLWSPESPSLYTIKIRIGKDKVISYAGFRTISTGLVKYTENDGVEKSVQRPLLNGEWVFMFGALDQGYWPDGIYTAATYQAMITDLTILKSLGMNMIRKHVKVESDLFYYACDQLGILVIQDMPNLARYPNELEQSEFERQVLDIVEQHKNSPSIVAWVIYTEGWGQKVDQPYPEISIVERVQGRDPTRLVDATSGWFDHGAGDFSDSHNYPGPNCGTPFGSKLASQSYDGKRIAFQGEFGGIGTVPPAAHTWNVSQAVEGMNKIAELHPNVDAYNKRAHELLMQLRDNVEKYACSGAVWTQLTDVEGEVNGLATYDRSVMRASVDMWREDIKQIFEAARKKGAWGGKSTPLSGGAK